MSERGFIAITRGVLDHPVVGARKPYSEYEAWQWMLFEAAYRSRRVRIGASVFELQRGQLANSERFLASKWGWSKSKVHRFFGRLEIEAMVSRNSDHETNLITICNYEEHQNLRTNEEPQTGPQTGPAADQQRTKERNQVTKEPINISPRAARSAAAERFEIFWKVYPKRASASPKKPARLRFEALVKRGVDPQAIIAGAREYAAEQDRLGKTGTQYVKTPEVWLNQEGWTAFEQARAGPPPELSDPIERMKWVRAQMEAENGAQNEPAGRNRSEVLDGGNSVCAANDGRREESKLVFSHARNGGGDGGMAKLFSVPPRLSAGGD